MNPRVGVLRLGCARNDVDADELEARKVGWEPLPPKYTTGVLAKYRKLVSSAAHGAITG